MLRKTLTCATIMTATTLATAFTTGCGEDKDKRSKEAQVATADTMDSFSIRSGASAPVSVQPDVGALQKKFPNQTNFSTICTARLIGPKLILTAAHCVSGEPTATHPQGDLEKSDTLRFAATNGKTYAVVHISRHPDYLPFELDPYGIGGADLAILKLAAAVPSDVESRWIFPAAAGPEHIVGATTQLVGYGLQSDSSKTSKRLQAQVQVTHLADGNTFRSFDAKSKTVHLKPVKNAVMIFQPLKANGSIGCNGDSGAPFNIDLKPGNVILGILSGGITTPEKPCANTVANIATALAPFTGWINSERARLDAGIVASFSFLGAPKSLEANSCVSMRVSGVNAAKGVVRSGFPLTLNVGHRNLQNRLVPIATFNGSDCKQRLGQQVAIADGSGEQVFSYYVPANGSVELEAHAIDFIIGPRALSPDTSTARAQNISLPVAGK